MNWVQRKIYLYNVTFGLYMLDWWERFLFNSLVLVLMWFIFYNGSRNLTQFYKSEWGIGNREDLVKDIIAEIEDLVKDIIAEIRQEICEIRFRRGLPPGDGVLFYIGEVFSSSYQPVASPS